MITVSEADRLLAAHVRPFGVEAVPLFEAAGRVLREAVAADRDQPPFDRVAMDGIAVAFAGIRAGISRFRIAGTQAAGAPPLALPDVSACIEIMTGAAMPEGCDTVVPYERIRIEGGEAVLRDPQQVAERQNVHARGSDRRAGDQVLETGTRLRPHHVAALAALGRTTVQVSARPRIGIVTTGDELVPVEERPLPHQIRQSNGPAIRAALVQRGYDDVSLEHVRDDAARLRESLESNLHAADVLMLSGGVSAGRFDLVPEILHDLGVAEVFHKVKQKPGKPLWFGVSERGQAVFGLPGNPVSVLVCLYRYVLPFLARCAGAEPTPSRALLTEVPDRKNDFTHFVPVRRDGLEAHLVPTNGSGDFFSILASDGFAEVPAELTAPGPVSVFSWSPD